MSRYRKPPRGRRLLMALAGVMCILAGPAAVIALAAPEYVSPPEIVGNAQIGQRLVCSSGTWKGFPKFKYEFVREGIEIPDEGHPYYFLTKADEHKEVWCVVTATEGAESARAESINSVCLGGNCGVEPPTPPEAIERPKVSGEAKVGATLTCLQGKWSGRPPPTFTYKWLRDKKEAIGGATSSTYTVVAEDETHALSCRVTGTNEAGEATAESTNTVSIPGSPPKNTKPPEVLGEPAVNNTLTCYQGTWTGSEPMTFEFRWLRNGSEIPMATGITRPVEPIDEGQKLSCKVVAKNGLGEAEAVSAQVAVSSTSLESTGSPVITGTPEVGHTLTCSEGSWNEPTAELKFKYQWLRDKTETIGSASNQYKVEGADRGHLLYCQVEAKNEKRGGKTALALSEPVGVKQGSGVPKIKENSRPEIEPGPRSLGATLTCNPGSWTPSPEQYVYQWLREKVAIASGTKATYEVTTADEGHELSCKVIAENSEGPSEPAESLPAKIAGEAPNGGQPEVVGSSPPRVGESLTCLRGEWKGEPTPTFTYEWQRDGTERVGSSEAYTIGSKDRGHSLSCTVTAKNSEGFASVSSSNSVKIPGSPPEPPLAGPTISGEPVNGSKLTCAEGAWTGAPPPTFTFQWLLNGVSIPGATGPTFTVGSVDRGLTISCRVTGTSTEGTASALSKGVHIAGSTPELVQPPFISGSAAIGLTLTCQRGVWNGKPPPSFTYQWYRDGATIASATEDTYTVEPADQGHLLSCNVTARNSEGSVEAESTNSIAIATHQTKTLVETPGFLAVR